MSVAKGQENVGITDDCSCVAIGAGTKMNRLCNFYLKSSRCERSLINGTCPAGSKDKCLGRRRV